MLNIIKAALQTAFLHLFKMKTMNGWKYKNGERPHPG